MNSPRPYPTAILDWPVGERPREAFGPALRESAAFVIFVHNHPSGDPEPSEDDVQITRRLKETGEILGIRVLDHLVVGDGSYYSFADEGQL